MSDDIILLNKILITIMAQTFCFVFAFVSKSHIRGKYVFKENTTENSVEPKMLTLFLNLSCICVE